MKYFISNPPWEECGQKTPVRWFAWHPVWTQDGYIVWLQWVWKSRYVTQVGVFNEYSLKGIGEKIHSGISLDHNE